MNRNCPVSVGGSVRRSIAENKAAIKAVNGVGVGVKATVMASAVLAAAGIIFYFGTAVHAAPARAYESQASSNLSSKSLTIPMFFEPNQGQTAPQVKFLARGRGYGLFLTADEAVLQLQPSAVSLQPSESSSQFSVPGSQFPEKTGDRRHFTEN